MGKSSKLALEEQEKQSLEKKEPKVTKQLIVGLAPEFREQLVAYLETRPYGEVANLVTPLKQTKPFEITING